MPNKQYIAGRRYEYKIKKQLEGEGWNVTRSAGSHGLFDLIAIRQRIESRGVLAQHDGTPSYWHKITYPEIKLIQLKTGKTKKKMISDVEKTDIKKWEGMYSVTVEVL